MKQKPITPYARLLKQFSEFCNLVFMRSKREMFYYKKSDIKADVCFDIEELFERTQAAQQLNYQVVLEAKEDGLHVYYVKNLPPRPWNIC